MNKIIGILLTLITQFSLSFALEAHITILPDTVVEVGEEVFFSSMKSTGIADPIKAIYEWDFGNGHAVKRFYPLEISRYSGPSCVHFFMRPGTFTVKFWITDTDGNTDTAYQVITVNGETPIEGFELWRASFHGRIAQYVYVQIPENIRSTSANSLKVRIVKDQKDTSTLVNRSSLKAEESFLFKNSELDSGNYEILADLLDASGKRISRIKEKFLKPYNGAPKIGINEHNALIVNGKPFFPVTPFILSKRDIPEWSIKYINSANASGFYNSYSTDTWKDYLDFCHTYNLPVIGPTGRWDGVGTKGYLRNSDINKMIEYINSAKDHPAMAIWSWIDEPNVGGRGGRVPGQIEAAWNYIGRKLDHNHLMGTNLYGYTYLPYYGNSGEDYDYLRSHEIFGGKKHAIFDVLGFDIYPLQRAHHASLKGRRVMSEYIEAIKLLIKNNYNLIPTMSYIEVQKIDVDTNLYGHPSYEQILMEAWINVVHGIKGINWFHYFGVTPESGLKAMETFYNQITKYTDIILGPVSSKVITNNATSPSNRVDFTVREKNTGIDSTLYIFAVRVTEPDSAEFYIQTNEPESISVEFKIPSISSGTVFSELDKKTIEIKQGVFKDVFKKCDIRIYRIGNDILKNRVKPVNMNKSHHFFLPQFNIRANIQLDLDKSNTMSISNIQGRLISKTKLKNNTITFDKQICNGVYIIKHDQGEFKHLVNVLK